MTIHWCGTGLSAIPGLRALIKDGQDVVCKHNNEYINMSRKFPRNAIRSYIQTYAKHIFAHHRTLRKIKGVRITFIDKDKPKDKPNICWLQYDSASKHDVDWVQHLETCLDWIRMDGVVLLVFPRRNNLSYLLQQIQLKGTLHDIYQYKDKSHMIALSVVKRNRNQPQLSRFATPQEGQKVKVKDHTGTWEGVVRSQYAANEYEVYKGKRVHCVFKDEITHAIL